MNYQKEVTIEFEKYSVDLTVSHGSIDRGDPDLGGPDLYFNDFHIVAFTELTVHWLNIEIESETVRNYLNITVALYKSINYRLDEAEKQPWYEDYVKGFQEAEREGAEAAKWDKIDHAIDERKNMLRGL
jgi:hypothetical protein